jgi:hypothetical protein
MPDETNKAPTNSDTETTNRDRPARNPGGIECQRCKCIFVGEKWHTLCRVCMATEMAKARAGPVYQQMIRERENAKAVEAVLREFNHHAGSMAQVIVYLRGQRKEQTT